MITYQKALEIILNATVDYGTTLVPIDKSLGMVLAEDLFADREFPPFDRITMDGVAILYDQFEGGQRSFIIEGIGPAGAAQKSLMDRKKCIEVMTGAMLPKNTDTVIRYEDLTIVDDEVSINLDSLKRQQNVHFRGLDVKKGAVIATKGKRIGSAEIAVAATIGKSEILVKKMPKAVVVSTGDELVDVHENPLPHQIRRSNVYSIQATLNAWGLSVDRMHIPDEKESMKTIISKCMVDHDFMIFSGGVSKGKYDFLPEVLTELKVQKRFHRVQQRPGKPFWFGLNEENKPIFALPGNPVSTFACMYVYVRSWLLSSLEAPLKHMQVALSEDYTFKPDLALFLQVKIISHSTGQLMAKPVIGNGSGDFANLVHADGFIILPQGKELFLKGQVFPFVGFRDLI